MRTLVFCTTFSITKKMWDIRTGLWLDRIKNSHILHDAVLMVDDGSRYLPPELHKTIGELPEIEPISPVLYHYENRLGRDGLHDYPGWYRSFFFGSTYAKKYGYEKVVHIESDSIIISDKMVEYINKFDDGWECFWCASHNTPETAIQIIAGKENIEKYSEFENIPYSVFKGRAADPHNHEKNAWMPYRVNKDFCGDRWVEKKKPIPENADYACQTTIYT